jgi:phosphoglycerate dehydrogenase-like enzyme
VALTREELAAFIPSGPLGAELRFDHTLHYASGFTSAAKWHQEITESRPDVILGAWSTAPLPVPSDDSLPTRYYCHFAGSVRNTVPRELIRKGLLVTNWGHSMARYVAESALMLTLAGQRRLADRQIDLHCNAGWRESSGGEDSLFRKRIGLHGFGAVAREFVQLVRPFNPVLTAFDPFVSREVFDATGVAVAPSLQALFSSSDILIELCALTESTRRIVNGGLLRQMPAGALFVNVARGQLVDEAALIELVRAGRLRAALDVFEKEPLPIASPLRGLRGVTLFPHLSGNTPSSRIDAGRFALENLHNFAASIPLNGVVSLEHFDRMT